MGLTRERPAPQRNYTMKLERIDTSGDVTSCEYDTGTHEVIFRGRVFPNDLEFFTEIVAMVKYKHTTNRLPRQDVDPG